MTFTKLFSSITESTVWCESDQVRIVWITMLAMANKNGFVFASIPGLANRARVTVESAREAIQKFQQPDPDSRTKDFDGRRIEEVDGGWKLLNYSKHRAIRDEEERREYMANLMRKKRAVSKVSRSKPALAQAEAEAEAEAEAIKEHSVGITPAAQKQEGKNELDRHSAAKGLGELIGLSSSGFNLQTLVSAIDQGKRRWPEERNEVIAEKLVAVWKEYTMQTTHAKLSLKNFLDQVGSFIDSNHWKTAPLVNGAKPAPGYKPTPEKFMKRESR